ncbi:MAG: hypothetical protein WBG92_19045 [Thiohalocapsa sp.]
MQRSLALATCVLSWYISAQAQPPRLSGGEPPRIGDWVTLDWWTPMQSVSGLLNADDLEDIAVILERTQDTPEEKTFERGDRALLILYGTESGGWRQGAMVPGMLPCSNCSDAAGSGEEATILDLSIADDRVLEIAWLLRNGSTQAVRLFIGWDDTQERLGLIADDVIRIQPVTGERNRVRRDYRAGKMWADGAPSAMRPRFIPIDELATDAY